MKIVLTVSEAETLLNTIVEEGCDEFLGRTFDQINVVEIEITPNKKK